MRWGWILSMAYRDSRKNRSRLFLFISSIILGIASLVAMNSFNENLKRDINNQAAELIGADLELQSNRKPNEETLKFIDSIKSLSLDFSMEERFLSMVRFSKGQGSRFVQVRAVQGVFPFYGTMVTKPSESFEQFGQKNGALLDNSLLLQFNAQINDTIHLGNNQIPILGGLLSQTGRPSISGAMAPNVYVRLSDLQGSGLQQAGSRIEYHYYFKLPKNFSIDEKLLKLKDRLTELQLRSSTISSTKENTGRSFSDMANYMELVGFAALLLGCIGVSSAVQIFIKEKLVSVAVLRCLGATAKQTFFIFLIQFAGIGLIGGIIGSVLGSLIQLIIPQVMQQILPVALSTEISWSAIGQGVSLGLIIAILFALIPLLSVRKISPLNSLRITEQKEGFFNDKLTWWVYALILLFILLFTRFQMDDWKQTIIFTIGIALVFFFLYVVAWGFTTLIKKYFPSKWTYVWRQGLANLYRPNNQTVILIVSIGLGTALIATLFFVQDILIQRVKVSAEQNEANILLFDIQPSQRDSLKLLAHDAGYPIVEEVPIVTMTIESINGTTLKDVINDSTQAISARAFRGEIRATYRDSLINSERLVQGKWIGEVTSKDTAIVSIDKNYAERINVKVGDQLRVNVQGLSIPAVISSIREVDWNRFQSNFRLVFAKGTFEHAPQFYLMMSKVKSEQESMHFQQQMVRKFPNVSILDLNVVLKVLGDILDSISFIIQFIGSFSILTGIVVLISSVRISKYQRLKENVLLRTLGASSKQIYIITISEYFFLGLLSAIAGIFIALVISNILAIGVFETSFIPSPVILIGFVFFVVALTILVGLLNSFSILNRSPLEALRQQ